MASTSTGPSATSRSAERSADVAIIGLGSAGEALAGVLLAAGRSVVGFEPGFVGGECPFTACMPSKALLHDAHRTGAKTSKRWHHAVKRRDEITDHRDDAEHAADLVDNGLVLVRERAEIVGPQRVLADGTTWHVEHVVLATGSAAVVPPIDGLDRNRCWTSEDALTSSELPDRLVIIGAGAIGCELGDVYRNFGSRVTLLESSDRLLPDHDADVAEMYARLLNEGGIDLRLSAEVTGVEHDAIEDGATAMVSLGDGTTIPADRILVATGQSPRLDGIGLDSLGIDDGDMPEVDAHFTASQHPWLHLIGDVNGRSPWTHGANREAAIASASILGKPWEHTSFAMPHCVFTDPPAAHVGRSSDAYGDDDHRALRGVGHVGDVARQSTDELGEGMVVLTIDADTGVIVGGSAVGPLADELIATVGSWVHLEAHIERVGTQVFAFPTISQVLEVAASDGLEKWRTAQSS